MFYNLYLCLHNSLLWTNLKVKLSTDAIKTKFDPGNAGLLSEP